MKFIRSVHEFFLNHSKLVLAGDFNGYDDPRNKFGGNVTIFKELSNFNCF